MNKEKISIEYNPATKLLYINGEVVDEDYLNWVNSVEPYIAKYKVLPNKECGTANVQLGMIGNKICFVRSKKEANMKFTHVKYVQNYLKWKGLDPTTANTKCTLDELLVFLNESIKNNGAKVTTENKKIS